MDVQTFYRKKNRENIDSDSDLSESSHDISISVVNENKYMLNVDVIASNNCDTLNSRPIYGYNIFDSSIKRNFVLESKLPLLVVPFCN